jgi:hypothetical protein
MDLLFFIHFSEIHAMKLSFLFHGLASFMPGLLWALSPLIGANPHAGVGSRQAFTV